MIMQSPQMLLLLVLLPGLAMLMARAQRLRAAAAATLRGPKHESPVWKRRAGRQLGAFTALILALARPAWNPHPGPAAAHGRDLVIALDISRSMLATDVFPSRLEAAKIALHEALPHLQGQRIGLLLFAGAASVRVPLTHDHHFVRYMLDRATPFDADVGSTSLQAAIEKAIDVVLRESEEGKQDLIILTDGEDHISDIEKTTESLKACGARVLIVGLGDSVAGARVPEVGGTNAWMQHKGKDVISRLDETTLLRLAESPNVTYHAAGTRPFDLVALYRQILTTTPGVPSTETGQILYTEGYPFLIALALLLLFCPVPRKLLPLFGALLIAGCTREMSPRAAEYAQTVETGRTLWLEAQAPIAADPQAALPLLMAARDTFLRAALMIPGDRPVAQQIAGVTAQIREIEDVIKQLPPPPDGQDNQQSDLDDPNDESDSEWDEDMEWSEFDMQSDMSMPMSSQNYKTALETRSLPSPNYTAEEILMQEAANQEQRVQQKADRAGAKVEKNW